MVVALKETVVERLRSNGFKGSFPHFRRRGAHQIELLTFQFDKWGGGFVIEIARCPPDSVTHPSGERISPSLVTAWDVHPNERIRLQPSLGSSTSDWFRYDLPGMFKRTDAYSKVAANVLTFLEIAERWWRGEDDAYISAYKNHFRLE
jgi:hypothetical protein